MKKIISILLCGVIVLGLVGCGKKETKTVEQPKAETETENKVAEEKETVQVTEANWEDIIAGNSYKTNVFINEAKVADDKYDWVFKDTMTTFFLWVDNNGVNEGYYLTFLNESDPLVDCNGNEFKKGDMIKIKSAFVTENQESLDNYPNLLVVEDNVEIIK